MVKGVKDEYFLYFCTYFHHKVLIYSHSTNGETGELCLKLLENCKRLRDSILLSVFSSHIFARYKNEALWI